MAAHASRAHRRSRPRPLLPQATRMKALAPQIAWMGLSAPTRSVCDHRHWPSQLDDRATTSPSLLGRAPLPKTVRGDPPEAGLHLALRRARSEYWCPTPRPIMVAGGEHCQLRAAIEVLVPYTCPLTAKPGIVSRQSRHPDAKSRACTLQATISFTSPKLSRIPSLPRPHPKAHPTWSPLHRSSSSY
jgi:hypothetical protein